MSTAGTVTRVPPSDYNESRHEKYKNNDSRKRRRALEVHERRTLYLLGLPENVTTREIRNMLRFFPGYLKCQLYKNSGKDRRIVMGAFALFQTQPHALSVQNRLRDLVFDPEKHPTTRIDCRLAVKNLVMTRSEEQKAKNIDTYRSQQTYQSPFPKLPLQSFPRDIRDVRKPIQELRRQHPRRLSEMAHYDSRVMPPYDGSDSLGVSRYSHSRSVPVPLLPTPVSSIPDRFGMRSAMPYSSSKRKKTMNNSKNPKDGTPGTTLFLSNLQQVADDEIVMIARMCDGFFDSKITQDKKGHRVAFVAYRTTQQAKRAMAYILSNPKDIRAAFAKNPLGKYSNVPKRHPKTSYHNQRDSRRSGSRERRPREGRSREGRSRENRFYERRSRERRSRERRSRERRSRERRSCERRSREDRSRERESPESGFREVSKKEEPKIVML